MIITQLTLAIGIAIILSNVFLWCWRWRLSKREHRLKMELERIEQVYHFRMRMMYVFGANWSIDNVADFMPSYEEMVKSDKPLVASEWVNVDKLVNLN